MKVQRFVLIAYWLDNPLTLNISYCYYYYQLLNLVIKTSTLSKWKKIEKHKHYKPRRMCFHSHSYPFNGITGSRPWICTFTQITKALCTYRDIKLWYSKYTQFIIFYVKLVVWLMLTSMLKGTFNSARLLITYLI